MSPVVKLESAQANMLGTHIQDTTSQWIVMFSKNASDLFKISSTSYLFKPSAVDSKHILLDMEPSKTFYISQSSDSFGTTVTVSTSPQTGATTVSSSDSGVLNFDLNGSTNGDTTPPANPKNLQVN